VPALGRAVPAHRMRTASQLRENSQGSPWYAACSIWAVMEWAVLLFPVLQRRRRLPAGWHGRRQETAMRYLTAKVLPVVAALLLWAVATPADAGSGWFLLAPRMDDEDNIYPDLPLSDWRQIGAFETALACQATLDRITHGGFLRPKVEKRALRSVCVPTDDPRLVAAPPSTPQPPKAAAERGWYLTLPSTDPDMNKLGDEVRKLTGPQRFDTVSACQQERQKTIDESTSEARRLNLRLNDHQRFLLGIIFDKETPKAALDIVMAEARKDPQTDEAVTATTIGLLMRQLECVLSSDPWLAARSPNPNPKINGE
jgi:hypothetical protein